MNLVDKSANIRRGFADVEIKSESVLFTFAEKRDDLKQRIADINNAMDGKIHKILRKKLAGQRNQLQIELDNICAKIADRIDKSQLLLERLKQAITPEAFSQCAKLAELDYERLAGQIHIGDDE